MLQELGLQLTHKNGVATLKLCFDVDGLKGCSFNHKKRSGNRMSAYSLGLKTTTENKVG
jgi:hypothetical protein